MSLAHRSALGVWRVCGDGRVATLASGVALVAGVAGATGHADTTLPLLGIGLGASGLGIVGYAIAGGGG